MLVQYIAENFRINIVNYMHKYMCSYMQVATWNGCIYTLQNNKDCFNPVWLPQLQFKGHLICK